MTLDARGCVSLKSQRNRGCQLTVLSSSPTNWGRRDFAHLDMKVAELNDGESVEGLRQAGRLNAIVPYVDLCRVANASPIEARRH